MFIHFLFQSNGHIFKDSLLHTSWATVKYIKVQVVILPWNLPQSASHEKSPTRSPKKLRGEIVDALNQAPSYHRVMSYSCYGPSIVSIDGPFTSKKMCLLKMETYWDIYSIYIYTQHTTMLGFAASYSMATEYDNDGRQWYNMIVGCVWKLGVVFFPMAIVGKKTLIGYFIQGCHLCSDKPTWKHHCCFYCFTKASKSTSIVTSPWNSWYT